MLHCWDWSGGKEYTSCSSRKMLKDDYLLTKIGVDTAENEPEVEVWSINYTCTSYVEPRHRQSRLWAGTRAGSAEKTPADLSWKIRYRTLIWFFSQMSKLQRARSLLYRRQVLQKKYSLESSWRDLQDLHAFAPLRPQYFRKNSSFFPHFLAKFCKISLFLSSFRWVLLRFRWNFVGISPII